MSTVGVVISDISSSTELYSSIILDFVFCVLESGIFGDVQNEFLIEKKDPLVLPPDFENLPSPDERTVAAEENEIFQNST